MLKPTFILSLLLTAGLWSGRAQAQDEAPAFPAHAQTLSLSDTLASWGRLGGVTVDRLGYVYVANFHDAVWRIAPDGRVRLLTDALYGASGNAVDARGTLLQANFFANTISAVSRTGEVTTWVDEGLDGPVGLAVAPDGDVFVCNCSGNTVDRVTPDGVVHPFATSDRFACPNGLTFGDDGTLYVASFSSGEIIRIAPDGTAEAFATVPGGGNAHIVFARGYLYVTHIRSNRVYRVGLDGTVQPFAGTGALGFADGPAPEATFARPNGLAVDPTGTVLYTNTLDGTWLDAAPSRLVVRRIELTTAADVVEAALEADGIEAARAAYQQYKADPFHADEPTGAEMVQLGLRLLTARRVPEALAVFELNAASYPASWRAQERLGFAYEVTGRQADAVQVYERVLTLAPDQADVRRRLEALR